MMVSVGFGKVGDTEYDQFVQINTPLKQNGRVVAILMLNKFANPVAAAVRAKTLRVVALSAGLLATGLVLFAFISIRMLRPLRELTVAAGEVAAGNLGVTLRPPRSRDEVGRLSETFGGMLEGLRQRDFIRDTFGRYVTKEVVDELLGSPDGLRLGGEGRTVTILVTDLRGFTALAATLAPAVMLEILNRYLERMVPVIRRHRGTIDAPVAAHNLIQEDFKNPDDHLFLLSAAQRFGLWYSRAGNGVSHPVHQERFGRPGKTLLGSDSHTPAAGAMGMLAIGAGGLEVALAIAGQPYHFKMPKIWGVRLVGRLPTG